MITDHTFRPYADSPDLCVAELPANGDTCNRDISEHEGWECRHCHTWNISQYDGDTTCCDCKNDEAGDLIDMLRLQAVNDLDEVMVHLRAARTTITSLMGNNIYDAEWEEGDAGAAALNLVISAIAQVSGAQAIASKIASI